MTPEEYRALAERCADALDRPEGYPSAEELFALLREASAAIPALLAAREEDRADIESLTDDASALRTERDQTHARMGALVLRAEEAEARVAALRAQLADATTITDEARERAIEALALCVEAQGTYAEGVDAVIAASRIAAALSVPAVPEEKAL